MTQPGHPSSVDDTHASAPQFESLADILARIEERYIVPAEGARAASPHGDTTGATHPSAPTTGAADIRPLPPALPLTDYIPAEVFLENMGFFTPSSKRIRHIYLKEKKVAERIGPDGVKQVLKVTISANHTLGVPITSDLDYYRAFLKIFYETMEHSERLRLPIRVPTKTLLRYAGKAVNQRVLREVHAWFERMTLTGIKGAVYQTKRRDYQDGFIGTLFSQAVLKGQRRKNGDITDTNYVWPAPWFLSNYLRGYIRRIDLDFHNKLHQPIAKSLYPLLETGWYASSGHPFAKSYRALCEDFLLTTHRQLSLMKRQLDPAHTELQQAGFLHKHQYKEVVAGSDWIILYWPGPKFFHDQETRETRARLAGRLARKQRPAPLSPPPTTTHTSLLHEMLTVCGDTHNKGAYVKILGTYPESLIRMTLAETRQAAQEQRIHKNKGAFFMDTLKRLSEARAPADASAIS